uniref:Apoptosis-mediating surface antigen FAS n=1 Tax=Dicentrarchus labrax TaxID=13489 RepID=A0A8C4NRI1_DICLA
REELLSVCGAGWRVVKHCNTNLQRGECKECEAETYSSYHNDQTSCEPCTSCSHPNANLEVVEHCTPASDAKCGCKKDHYCVTAEESCKLCHPCKTCDGPENIKEPCTGHSNTVCKEIREGGNTGRIIAVVIIPVVAAAAVMVGVFIWKKRTFSRQRQGQLPNDVEMQLLYDKDLQPYLPDIAEAMGWKDMKYVAIRSKIPMTAIESCQLDHPHDSKEQTVKLLMIWVEKQGSDAAKNLLEILQRSGKRRKAENVKDILSRG